MAEIGNVFRMRTWRDYPAPQPGARVEAQWMDYKHPDKTKVGVFVFLGGENKDGTGQIVDVDEVLKAMGWTPPPKEET